MFDGPTGHSAASPYTSDCHCGVASGSTAMIGSIEYMPESWPMFQKSQSCHCKYLTGSILDMPKNEPFNRSIGCDRIGIFPLHNGFLMMPRISSCPAK